MNKPEVEPQSSLNRFVTLAGIPGSSGNEADVAAEIVNQLISFCWIMFCLMDVVIFCSVNCAKICNLIYLL